MFFWSFSYHKHYIYLLTKLPQIIQKPNAERTQRLFASLREELERKGPRAVKKPVEGPVGG